MIENNFISIIPLSKARLEAPFLSKDTLDIIRENKKNNKKTLLFYNRRWTARAWMCEDCGFFEKCPHCDIAFAYHTSPIRRLVCHQCNTVAPFPVVCPHCQWSKIIGVGVGIERIQTELTWLLWSWYGIVRMDSDAKKKIKDLLWEVDAADVILSTSLGSTLVHADIGSVVFLSFEANLSMPEYDIEEQIFDEILYYKKQQLPIYIQTHTPEHPLLQEILHGNHKSYMSLLRDERRAFLYPPFAEFVTIRVHHPYQKNVTTMINHLFAKIDGLKWSDIFLAADKDIWEKRWWEWSQKIIIKGKNLISIVRELEVEVVRNRSVSLEWN